VTRDWRSLHNEEHDNINSSPNIIRVMKSRRNEMNRAYSTHRRDEKCIQNFSRKSLRKE
jgi:hypothetical protein